MKPAKAGRKRRLKHFSRHEDGAATVEAVLWLPVFIVFFGLLVDATMIMFGQAQTLRVVQDLNRGISLGRIENAGEIDAFIERYLPRYSDAAVVHSSVEQGVISTRVTIPSKHFVASGLLNVLPSFDVHVSAQHLAEN